MAEDVFPPFSVRNRGAHAQVDNGCPDTFRIGLHYLVRALVDGGFVAGWKEVELELQRIGRIVSVDFNDPSLQELLLTLPWDKIFDFCERLHNHLAQEISRRDQETGDWMLVAQRSEVQKHIANELQRLFLEEHLAFEFYDGRVRRRGRRNTTDQSAVPNWFLAIRAFPRL